MIRRVFGNVTCSINTSVGGTPRYQYSNACGKFLSKYGAPVGAKIRQPGKVPKWIISGKKGVRVAFISALFDDEDASEIPKMRGRLFSSLRKLLNWKMNWFSIFRSFGKSCIRLESKHLKSGQTKEKRRKTARR